MIGCKKNRYVYCETINKLWWYKDLKTQEDLPLFIPPRIYNNKFLTQEQKIEKSLKLIYKKIKRKEKQNERRKNHKRCIKEI